MPVLSDSTRGGAACNPKPARNPLGYAFDPVPKVVGDLVTAGVLLPIDAEVMRHLVRFRRAPNGHCWTTKAVVAARVNRSPRTVQRSFERLTRAGLIGRVRVSSPDPEEPSNRTGWRFVLPCVGAEPRVSPPGATVSPPPGPETPVSPPRETAVSPPPETPVSPNTAGGSNSVLDGREQDGTTTTAVPAGSSSCRASEGGEAGAGALAPLIAKAQEAFGRGVGGRVRAAVRGHGAYRVERALAVALTAKARSWGFVLGVLRNWENEGGPLEPPPSRAPSPPPPPPARPAEVPIEETPPDEVAEWRRWLADPHLDRFRRQFAEPRLKAWEEAMARPGRPVTAVAV